jgi:hypothetical protein
MTIPKIIWQTHVPNLEELPPEAKAARKSWVDLNPNYEVRYLTNDTFRGFIQEYYGDEWVKIYDRLDMGIQRADVWRTMIVHQFGGVYVDLDLRCRKPIDSWLTEDYDAFITVDEAHTQIGYFIFAATANHPILTSVLETIKKNVNSIPEGETIYPYRDVGTLAFTEGIKTALGITTELDLFNNVEEINESIKAKELKVHCFGNKDRYLLHKGVLENLMGRTNWFDGKYSWLEQMGGVMGPTRTTD